MVDYLAFFCILLCYGLNLFHRTSGKALAISFVVAAGGIVQIQAYQKSQTILPWDKMTKEKYWYIFLETDSDFSYDLSAPYVPDIPHPLQYIVVKDFDIAYEHTGEQELAYLSLENFDHADNYYFDLQTEIEYATLKTDAELRVDYLKNEEILQSESLPVIRPQFLPGTKNHVRLCFIAKNLHTADHVRIRIRHAGNDPVVLSHGRVTVASF